MQKTVNDSDDVRVSLLDKNRKLIASLESGNLFAIDVKWKRSIDIFVVNIFRNSGEHVTAFRVNASKMKSKHFAIELSPRLGLGKYYIFTEMRNSEDKEVASSQKGPSFVITKQDPAVPIWSGMIYVEHETKTLE